MPGLVLNGLERPVGNWPVLNWRDDKRLRLTEGEDCGRRPDKVRVQSVVLHTTLGEEGPLKPGAGPDLNKELRVAEWWSTSRRKSGAHIVVDCDGSIACLADLLLEQAFHASGPINRRSIGIEIAQGPGKAVYEVQLAAVADLVDVLCEQFGIQKWIPDHYRGALGRLGGGGGNDFVGVVGHRDCTDDRDRFDPGDFIFQALAARGYRAFDLKARADVAFTKKLQAAIGVPVTGLADRPTVRKLKELGHPHGILAPDYELPA